MSGARRRDHGIARVMQLDADIKRMEQKYDRRLPTALDSIVLCDVSLADVTREYFAMCEELERRSLLAEEAHNRFEPDVRIHCVCGVSAPFNSGPIVFPHAPGCRWVTVHAAYLKLQAWEAPPTPGVVCPCGFDKFYSDPWGRTAQCFRCGEKIAHEILAKMASAALSRKAPLGNRRFTCNWCEDKGHGPGATIHCPATLVPGAEAKTLHGTPWLTECVTWK